MNWGESAIDQPEGVELDHKEAAGVLTVVCPHLHSLPSPERGRH
jgi:hypothetical protein